MFDLKKFPAGLLQIVKTLKDHQFSAYVVGGSLRDLLLDLPVTDWDVTTDALPEKVSKLFPRVVPTGIEFGTVLVMLEDGEYEVTTMRREEKYSDGRRPDQVVFTKNLDEDLARRDFTINALAYDPLAKRLVDNFSGQEDLKQKIIRTVGDAVKRFAEDGLRPYRACRLAAKLDFKIDQAALAAIPQTLEIAKKVAPERVRDEILKMMGTDKPSVGIELMRQAGLLTLCLPELEETFGVEQPPQYHKYDVYWHCLYSGDAAPKTDPLLRLAALLHDIGKPPCKVGYTFYNHDSRGVEMAEKILQRLRFSNDDIKRILNLIKNHMFEYKSDWGDAAVRRFIRRVGLEHIEDLFTLRVADLAGMEREIENGYLDELRKRIQKIIEEENALAIKDLKVDGNDVMQMLGVSPGPTVGRALEYLLEQVLDEPNLNQREKLLSILEKIKGTSFKVPPRE